MIQILPNAMDPQAFYLVEVPALWIIHHQMDICRLTVNYHSVKRMVPQRETHLGHHKILITIWIKL